MLLLLSSLTLVACSTPVQGWAGPAISSNMAYIVTQGEKVQALNLDARSRGEAFPASTEWQFPPESDKKIGPAYATPVLSGGALYVGIYCVTCPNGSGKVSAIEAATGRQIWEHAFGGTAAQVVGSPTVVGDTVYVGASNNYMYALDASSGAEKWKFQAGNKIWAGVASDGANKIMVASLDHNVYALDREKGTLLWTFKTGGSIASTPLLRGGILYFGSADGKLYAVDVASGESKWEFNAGSWLWGSPLLDNGVLYVGSLDAQVYALDTATGARKWSQPFRTGGPISATPVMVSGVLAVGAQDGRVYGLDPATGQQKWVYTADPSGAIFASLTDDGSTLYVMPFNQRLVALEGKTGTPKWSYKTGG